MVSIQKEIEFDFKDENLIEEMDEIFRYLYFGFKLDHDKMYQRYKKIKAYYDEDDIIGHDYEFFPAKEKDCEYYYQKRKIDKKIVYDYPKLIESIDKRLQKDGTKKLKFKGVNKLVLFNLSGVNEDTRGVRDLDWKLYFWDKYFVIDEEGISFDDLIIAAFKVKSHKFEIWYELFSGIRKIMRFEDCLVMWIGFDHGS